MRYSDAPTAEAVIEIDAPASRVWSLISDITLMPELSQELQEVWWLENATAPAVGSSFAGRSHHPAQGSWETTSKIAVFDPDSRFVWDVYACGDPIPSSTWGFELAETDGVTTLKQWGRIGPGRSNLNAVIERLPHKEARILEVRLGEIRAGLTANIEAIRKLVEEGRE
ncbi:SRPBCC family protein [Rhodococcus koreensis]